MDASTRRALIHGLAAGLIGYLAVVLFFMAWNLLLGRSPVETPALLGAALFGDATGGAGVRAGYVIAYNGIHLMASLLAGSLAAWLIHETEDHHVLWYAAFFVLLAGCIYTILLLGVVGSERLGVLSWPGAVAGTTVAALAMGLYLFATHRGLGRELSRDAEL